MDVFLIIITIIFSILLLVVSFYILALYCHPDDRGFGSHILLKILVIVGLTLSWAQVLMVPLDVANSRGEGGQLDMMSFWNTIYCIIAFMVTILLPFAIFMYETDEDKSIVLFNLKRRVGFALL
jgi:LMBR1 domain-containing protein 1